MNYADEITRALDAYQAEHRNPHVTTTVKRWAAERDHSESWTHIACMIAAVRAAFGEPPIQWPDEGWEGA